MPTFKQILIFPFIAIIKMYKYSISPLLGMSKCRYQPSCSTYAIQALEKHGLFKGGYLARWIHQKYPKSVCSLSIEFRKFFMDEWTGLPNPEIINEIGNMLNFSLKGVLEELQNFKTN